jgi:hypothetical protein
MIEPELTRRTILGGMAAGGVVALTGCGLLGNSIRYRYRLTVEVDTPEGLKSGSSVIQVDTSKSSGLEGSHIDTRVTGDAVAVDLPGGETLFALLDKAQNVVACGTLPPGRKNAQAAAAGHYDPDEWREEIEDIKARPGTCDLPRMGPSPFPNDPMIDQWPTLVHFRDIRDPRTLERVNPDNPAATLGPGIRIRRIIVQMTDDPVTTGIEKKLPWLHGYRQWMNVGGADFGADSFSTEAFK